MHAVVFEVEVKQGWEGDAEAELDMVVGMTTSSPGFVRGSWLSDGTTALSIQLFETAEQAQAIADGAFVPPEASVSLRSARVYEVQRDV